MASRQIFKDVEEALAREIRRISYHDERIIDRVVLRETYDPLTGEVVEDRIEPEFYDSSADAGVVQYPHVFIRLMKTREDRTSGRVVPQYGHWLESVVSTSPKAFEIVLSNSSALIPVVGNDVTVTAFQIRKVQVGMLLRLMEGNNKGTYIISNVTVSNTGDHTITVDNLLVQDMPVLTFNSTTRVIKFTGSIDLNTVKIGDNFLDSGSNSFPITAVDSARGQLTLGGTTAPLSSQGGQVTRAGDVFTSTDLAAVRFLVLDPTKPVKVATICGDVDGASETVGVSPPVPIDAFYMVRIDSKTRENHIDILNRVWEEFNPPRTALPVVIRSALSADQLLMADIPTGGSSTISVKDNSKYNVGESVLVFNDLLPVGTLDANGSRPFEAKILDILPNNQILLDKVVPDNFVMRNTSRVVSNAQFALLMFHLEDHLTKDIEGSQYWVHEFSFWVQLFIDRNEQYNNLENGVIEDGVVSTTVTGIEGTIENIDTGNIYTQFDDN